jgi:hypothetical protein
VAAVVQPLSGRESGLIPAPQPRSTLRAVALPSEHGGWGLTGEPVLLGLLVAPSISGALLGAGALVAFLARTPLKLALVDQWRRRRLPRTVFARGVAAGELTTLGGLLAVVALHSGSAWWLPLVAALPLVGVEMWFDMRSRGRRLVPELCGAVGIASIAAAVARAGGASWTISIGLWAVLAARSMGAVPFARAQVMRWRGRPAPLVGPLVAQAVAVAIGGAGWGAGLVPLASWVALVAFSGWALQSFRRPPVRPKILGYSQMFIGIALVLVTAGALRLG